MVDFTRVPASIIQTGFPDIVDLPAGMRPPELSDDVKRLSRLIDYLFTKTPEGLAKDHDCLIEGWNGEYISAAKGWNEGYDLSGIVAVHESKMVIPSFSVRVSDDFASADVNMRMCGCHDKNLISAMGTYIITFVEGEDGALSVLVDKRPENAAIYPGKFNGTGTAIPAGNKADYVRAVTDRTNRKYCLDIEPSRVRPLGIMFDNVYNITIPSGWVVVPQKCVGYDTKLMQVPVSGLEGFIADKAPIQEWNYPAFLAVCEGLVRLQEERPGRQGIDYGTLGKLLVEKEYSKLERNPLHVQSALQIIEQDLIAKGRSLIEYFSHIIDV